MTSQTPRFRIIRKWYRKLRVTSLIIGALASVTALAYNANRIKGLFEHKIDISGEWRLDFYIARSTYKAYIGKTSSYRIFFHQNDTKISGNGELWEVDYESIPFSQHIPITVVGRTKGDSVFISYRLKGALRESTGTFQGIYKNGKLIGDFKGTAANASGPFTGSRNTFN